METRSELRNRHRLSSKLLADNRIGTHEHTNKIVYKKNNVIYDRAVNSTLVV